MHEAQFNSFIKKHGLGSCASPLTEQSTVRCSTVGSTACLRIEVAGRQLAADRDPARADVAVLPEQLQPSSP